MSLKVNLDVEDFTSMIKSEVQDMLNERGCEETRLALADFEDLQIQLVITRNSDEIFEDLLNENLTIKDE